jgi:hypothetical protein
MYLFPHRAPLPVATKEKIVTEAIHIHPRCFEWPEVQAATLFFDCFSVFPSQVL